MASAPRLEIDVEDRAGVKVGEGPLTNVPYIRYSRALGESGTFETMLPLRDERVSLLEEKKHVLRLRWNNKIKFAGVLEETGVTVSNAGVLMVPVSGRCLGGAELSEAKIGFLELTNGSGAGVTDGPQDILTAADVYTPSTWTLDTDDGYSTTSTAVYAKFAGESALQALRKVADKIGEHWRFHPTDRKVVWMRTDTPDSGIRAIAGAPDMVSARDNPLICFFQSFEERKDVHGLFNQIHPYGGGGFDIAVTLNSTTRTAGAGFTLSKPNNYLRNDNSISALGVTIPLYVQFPDIRPISNTDADITAASNALFDAAKAMLERHDTVNDFQVYDLGGIVQLPDDVVPGSTLRVEYEDERYNVDANLIVLAIDSTINADASEVHRLTVATVDRMPSSGTTSIVNSMADGRVFQTHPILNVNSYETGVTKYVWRSGATEETAKIYFDFDDEVTTIQQVVLKFETAGGSPVQMLPLESTVRSVGGDASVSVTIDTINVTTSSTVSVSGTIDTTHVHDVDGGSQYILLNEGSGGADVTLFTGSGDLATLVYDGSSGNRRVLVSGTATTASGGSAALALSGTGTGTGSGTGSGSGTADLSSAISAVYGLYRETTANTFQLGDLRYRVNGGTWANLDTDATLIANNRYALDITAEVYDADFRPNQTSNTLEIARKDAGSFASRVSCTIDGVLKVRNIIQSTAIS